MVDISKYRGLMGYDEFEALLKQCDNLSNVSDEQLQRLYDEADRQYLFFKNMQITTKMLCNSLYGGLGTPSLRYFNVAVADDITAEGRNVCQYVEGLSNKYFNEKWHLDTEWHDELREKFPKYMQNVPKQIHDDVVVYADTDSNYIHFTPVFESLGLNSKILHSREAVDFMTYFAKNKLDPMFDSELTIYYDNRNGKNHMIFELEGIGGFGIWAGKKKYVYAKLWQDGKYVADKGDLKVTGLEIRQKSASKNVKNAIRVIVNMIFKKRGSLTAAQFFAILNNLTDAYKYQPIEQTVADLSKSTKLNMYTTYVKNDKNLKSLEFADKCPVVCKGAARYNALLKMNKMQHLYPELKDDMFVKMYYDTNGEPFVYSAEYGWPKEFAPKISINTQVEKLIYAPLLRLVGPMYNIELKQMTNDKFQQNFSTLLG